MSRLRRNPLRLAIWALATVLGLLLSSVSAHAKLASLDLGPTPTNGKEAVESMRMRETIVVETLACGDELRFLHALEVDGVRLGKWPLSNALAKAAFISDQDYPGHRRSIPFYGARTLSGERARDGADDCVFGMTPAENWAALLPAGTAWNGETRLVEFLNERYSARFGAACAQAFEWLGYSDFYQPILVRLTPECLAAQVGTLLRQPRLGQWEFEEDGSQVFKNPGTDGLPCVTEFSPGNRESIHGDWDMSVVQYTRLAYFLHEAMAIRPHLRTTPLGGDLPFDGRETSPPPQVPAGRVMDDALRKLDQFLLTLRGTPQDNTHNVVITCGNPDNHYGSAVDYTDGNDVYDEAEGQERRSFWEDLWKWLRFVLIVAAAAVVLIGGGLIVGSFGAGVAVSAGAAVAAGVVIAATLAGGIEETENHLLMINSSKYLKNKLMMAELARAGDADRFEQVAGENEQVRAWLLGRISRIAEEDFVEYNSKPYSLWSMKGLLNLRDFACEIRWDVASADFPGAVNGPCDAKDQALVTTVDALLDLHAAKTALGSLDGRRIVPFRRQASENFRYAEVWEADGVVNQPKRLSELGGGADHMLGALQFWTGVTEHAERDGRASMPSLGHMIWHATSGYRPHELILDIAIDKSTPYEQTITHEGHERYVSGPGYLITAGGDSEHEAQGFVTYLGWTWHWLAKDDDKGVGVPTTLIPAGGPRPRAIYDDFLRFEGAREEWPKDGAKRLISFSNNRCVTEGFACGLRLEIPEEVEGCLKYFPKFGWTNFRFVDSAACPAYADNDGAPDNDFYVAIYEGTCTFRRDQPECDERGWGFFEVAPRSMFASLEAYADAVFAANERHFADYDDAYGRREVKFTQVSQGGRTLEFTPEDEDFGADCRACGAIINHDGGTRFSITNPRYSGRIFIDLDLVRSSPDGSPVRRGEGGVTMCAPIEEYCFAAQ